MRHAPSILTAVVLTSLVGCATTPKRDEAAQGKTSQEQATAGGAACGPWATAVPTGIADEAGGVLFLRVESGIEAVDVHTGATLWRTPNVERAVAVGEGHVAGASKSEASTDAVRLALLDRRTGALVSLGPEVDLGVRAETAELRGAFCNASELDLVWSGVGGSGSARVDLTRRTVVARPGSGGGAGGHWLGDATVQKLQLKIEQGLLKAFGEDGALRWERPIEPNRLSARP